MSSGKQTNFSFGEISSLQKYNSDNVSYQNAVEKAYNMHTRRTGGLSNRAGTKLEYVVAKLFDDNANGNPMPDGFDDFLGEGQAMPIRSFGLFSQFAGPFIVTIIRDPDNPTEYAIFGYREGAGDVNNELGGIVLTDPFDLERMQVHYFKGYYVFTPSVTIDSLSGDFVQQGSTGLFCLRELDLLSLVASSGLVYNRFTLFKKEIPTYEERVANNNIQLICRPRVDGTPPAYPVSYLVTAVTRDGIEFPIALNGTIEAVPGILSGADDGTFRYPITYGSTAIRNTLYIRFLSSVNVPEGVHENMVALKFYRSAQPLLENETNPLAKNFVYVGKVALEEGDAGNVAVSFNDYGAEDPSETPPIDSSLVNGLGYIDNVECAASYQQRMYYGARRVTDNILKSGAIVASEVGQGCQTYKPIISKNTGAFNFEVPIEDSSKVVSMISDRRLVALTKKDVFVIAGSGEQGIITPSQINPLRISSEGCSERIRAIKLGNLGLYINESHKKLMVINLGKDFQVSEGSYFSEHLITSSICQLVGREYSSGDLQIFMLRRDGKISIASLSTDGNLGFSEYELPNARIVSMFSVPRARKYDESFSEIDQIGSRKAVSDVIGLYVKRANVVTLEYLDDRIDEKERDTSFLDCSVGFGHKLSLEGSIGFMQIPIGNTCIDVSGGNPINAFAYFNLTAPDFSAGQPITLTSNKDLATRINDEVKFKLFYDSVDSYGKPVERSIVVHPNWSTLANPQAGVYTVAVYCNYDLPEEVQDIDSKNISDNQKKLRKSRWLGCLKNWNDSLNIFNNPKKINVLYLAAGGNSSWDYANELLVLEDGGHEIGAMAEGKVVSAPLETPPNGAMKIYSDGGSVTIDEFPYEVCNGFIGIPYESEVETLPIEPADNRTFTEAKKVINKVGLALYNTGQVWVGSASYPRQYSPTRTRSETDISLRDTLFSGHVAPHIDSRWTEEGRISIKNLSPAPFTLIAVYPKGLSGE